VEAAVTLIVQRNRLLAVFNEPWSAFSLPMTKRRQWHDPNPNLDDAIRTEDWVDAAARAVADWLGKSFVKPPKFLLDIAEFRQGDRDGLWKRYHFQVFRVTVAPEVKPRRDAIAEWLTPAQLLDRERRPISPTARYLVEQLQAEGMFKSSP
jgi:hypothetical protein